MCVDERLKLTFARNLLKCPFWPHNSAFLVPYTGGEGGIKEKCLGKA